MHPSKACVRFFVMVSLAVLLAALSVGSAVAGPPGPTLTVDQLQTRIDAHGGSMSGYLKTVVKGATVIDIPVTVLAVTTGFGSGPADMSSLILFQATGPEIDRIGGIASGMSGSPIYVNDYGEYKLVGALSYGDMFTTGGTGLATPIGAMAAVQSGSGFASVPRNLQRAVVLDGQVKDQIVIASDASAVKSAPGNTIVAKPLAAVFIGGLDPKSPMYKAYAKTLESKGVDVVPLAGGLSAMTSTYNSPFRAGSAVAVLAARGDMWVGGVGTVTYVDGNNVLAFGHPAFWDGTSGLYLCNAWIDGIWPSTYTPYKLGRPAAVRGTLVQDRTAGIMGIDGLKPEDVPVTATAVNTANGKVAESTAWMPRFVADSASGNYYGIAPVGAYIAGSRVFDAVLNPGSAVTLTTVTVSDETTTYRLVRRNVYSNGYDIPSAVVSDVDDIVGSLQNVNANGIAHARVLSVDLQTTFSPTRKEAEIVDITVSGGLKSGENTVTVSFHQFGQSATQTVDVALDIPDGVALTGSLSVVSVNNSDESDGSSVGTASKPKDTGAPGGTSRSNIDRSTVKEVVDQLNEAVDNSIMAIRYQPSTGSGGSPVDPSAGSESEPDAIETTYSAPWVVSGDVTKAAIEMSVASSDNPVSYGGAPTIGCRFSSNDAAGKVEVTGLGGSPDRFEFTDGWASFSTPPLRRNTRLVITFLGDDFTLPAQQTLSVGVRAKTTLSASRRLLARGGGVTLTAHVLPKATGGKIAFQRRSGSTWKTIKTVSVPSGGAVAYTYTPGITGSVKVRARFTGSAMNRSSNSGTITLHIR